MISAERETLKRLLAEAEACVGESESRVVQQHAIVQEMRGDGHDLAMMQEFLATFGQRLIASIEERDRLQALLQAEEDSRGRSDGETARDPGRSTVR